jgi:hypothetical protein
MVFKIFMNIKTNPMYNFDLFITFAFFRIKIGYNSTRHKDSRTTIRFLYFSIKIDNEYLLKLVVNFVNLFLW